MKLNYIYDDNFFDWGKVSHEYARYRDIYPDKFYQDLLKLGIGLKGQEILAVGTGTGVLPRAMYKYGAKFTGTDISENQIATVRKLAEAQNMNIEWKVCPAENTGFANHSFDVITAVQCFQYFKPAEITKEFHRLLKKGGRLMIAFMNWLPRESAIARASEELVLKYNPVWKGANFGRTELKKPNWLGDLYEVEALSTFDVELPFTYETWAGRIRACRGIGASAMDQATIDRFNEEHLKMLKGITADNFTILHQMTIEVYKTLA